MCDRIEPERVSLVGFATTDRGEIKKVVIRSASRPRFAVFNGGGIEVWRCREHGVDPLNVTFTSVGIDVGINNHDCVLENCLGATVGACTELICCCHRRFRG